MQNYILFYSFKHKHCNSKTIASICISWTDVCHTFVPLIDSLPFSCFYLVFQFLLKLKYINSLRQQRIKWIIQCHNFTFYKFHIYFPWTLLTWIEKPVHAQPKLGFVYHSTVHHAAETCSSATIHKWCLQYRPAREQKNNWKPVWQFGFYCSSHVWPVAATSWWGLLNQDESSNISCCKTKDTHW